MAFAVEAEIASQPACWTKAIALAEARPRGLPRPGERVALVGCGTSWFMAQVVAHWRESAGAGPTDAWPASEFPTTRAYDRVVAVTRSGTTTEVVDLLESLRGRVPTTVVVATGGTPACSAADEVVALSFADEESVVQTRFATSVLSLFRSTYADGYGGGHRDGSEADPPDRWIRVLADAETALTAVIDPAWVEADQLTYLGRGWSVGLAHEAALKCREASATWAESYPAMEYRHGSVSVATDGRVVWMLGDPPSGLEADVTGTGATFVTHGWDPMAELVLIQRLAVARAVARGLDPDRPRHLTRSVVLSADRG